MIGNNYNDKFRKFFTKFEKEYFLSDNIDNRDFLWDLAVDFVEKNRDFVMQYPLINYWSNFPKINYENEKNKLLKSYNKKNINLYFHIPFCKTKCTYCNFHIIVWDGNKNIMEKLYIEKLKFEIDEFLKINEDFIIDTIFIGGWTPTYLSEENLKNLLWYIKLKLSKYFSWNIEYSLEWNPDSINKEKLKILKENLVNRLSIWVQSFDNEIIKKINRTYTDKIVFDVIKIAKDEWFENINIDMIYWLPGSNYDNMKKDLDIAKSLDITHITYYPLYYYENSILNITWDKKDNIKDIYNFYDELIKELADNWFKQYWREYFSKKWLIHHYQNNYVSNKLLYWFGNSAYSFNWKTAFYKEQNLFEYIKKNDIIDKIYHYDDENLDRRLFVLWSRNIIIEKVNIQNIDKIRNTIRIRTKLWLIDENKSDFILNSRWLKFQEILAHMIV